MRIPMNYKQQRRLRADLPSEGFVAVLGAGGGSAESFGVFSTGSLLGLSLLLLPRAVSDGAATSSYFSAFTTTAATGSNAGALSA
jgi:hypothetical protein